MEALNKSCCLSMPSVIIFHRFLESSFEPKEVRWHFLLVLEISFLLVPSTFFQFWAVNTLLQDTLNSKFKQKMMQFGRQEAAVLRGLAAADPAGVVLRRMLTHDFCGAHV